MHKRPAVKSVSCCWAPTMARKQERMQRGTETFIFSFAAYFWRLSKEATACVPKHGRHGHGRHYDWEDGTISPFFSLQELLPLYIKSLFLIVLVFSRPCEDRFLRALHWDNKVWQWDVWLLYLFKHWSIWLSFGRAFFYKRPYWFAHVMP